jgi:cytochrome c-type biogenesis protein CcsB
MEILKKISNQIFSASAGGLYMILFAVAIATATFIENDFGTSAAQKIIYKAGWFELLLVLFGVTIVVNIFRFRMIEQKKWAILAFHASIIVIIIGAGVTRYFGYEGMMHIREGDSSNSFLSAETHLIFEVTKNNQKYVFDEPVLFASLGKNELEKSYNLGGEVFDVKVLGFTPNPGEVMVFDEDGSPVIKVVMAGMEGREEYFIRYGNQSRIRGTLFNFSDQEIGAAFNIKFADNQLLFKAPTAFTQMVMTTEKLDTLAANEYHTLMLRSMYSNGLQNFVFGDFSPTARVEIASSSRKMTNQSMGGAFLVISNGTEEDFNYVYGMKGVEGRPRAFKVGDAFFSVSYGAKRITVPFSLRLRDFILERYPGTDNASSYASEVTLIDPDKGLENDQRIFMNNVLDYQGYRFFQSSYDKDELGTYLSVNHDWWGTWISYIGYIILTIGMILTLFSTKSRFRQLGRNLNNLRNKQQTVVASLIVLFMLLTTMAYAEVPGGLNIKSVIPSHAKEFGEVVMQDHRGRMKPMNTYTSEILRKLARTESIYGLSSEQVILGMAANPKDWYEIPLIKMGKHEKTKKILPVEGKLASYGDFFDERGGYILKEHVRNAYNTPSKDRGVFEKEMMKLDERVNICNMIYSGSFFKVFPVPEDENNTWLSPVELSRTQGSNKDGNYASMFYSGYMSSVQSAIHDNDWKLAREFLDELRIYQDKNGARVMPSDTKIKSELILNKSKIFSRLGMSYGLLSLVFLTLLFLSVFKPNIKLGLISKIAIGLFVTALIAHMAGLGLRWYVSGRAPWSNGYESMIYIGFTAALAGALFSRKTLGGLAATTLLAATILMVAGLSYMDPEITPLVPVLRSYWLTIHVSLEAGSYGFLMLGAIIGVLNLILMIFRTQKNALNTNRVIKELTQISEMTLIGGLFMISVGTYLGGVWANESWGRYWGWDAKETWALVTILVYAFILHMRFIPGFRGPYAFNVASLFGWASVIMTYFGVNYYLSGLHSYAAGDPVPIPSWVYYSVVILTVISLVAWWRDRAYR